LPALEGGRDLRIGVLSDSHGDSKALIKALNHMAGADVVFHLGDYVKDSEHIKKLHSGPLYVVSGNCDFFSDANIPSQHRITIEGKTVFATHGHKYRVKDGINALYYKGLEIGADIVLFGHTHCPQIVRVDEMVLLNPGSVFRQGNTRQPTYGIIEITNGNIKPVIVEF
jgi:putative phosphoesterase